MSTVTVQNVALLPDQTPNAGAWVTINLVTAVSGGAGYTSSGDIIGTARVQADANGHWTANLTPNNQITPANTYYQVIEGQAVSNIIVPASGGPYLIGGILATPPPTPAAPGITAVQVAQAGTVASSRPEINFIAGSGINVAVADNAGSQRADVTITSTGGAAYSRQIQVRADGTPSSVTAPVGTWTPTYVGISAFYGWVNQSDGTQNDSISFDFACGAGTYQIDLYHLLFQSRGIYTVQIDGTTVGTVDGYTSGGLAPARSSITGVVIGAGQHTVTLLMASKNASSSGYLGQVERLLLTRTA